MRVVSLNTLIPGEKATIVKIDNPTASVRQRLMEMGLTRRTKIQIIRYAPMGDPVEVKVKGYRLSLRKAEVESISVTLDE